MSPYLMSSLLGRRAEAVVLTSFVLIVSEAASATLIFFLEDAPILIPNVWEMK